MCRSAHASRPPTCLARFFRDCGAAFDAPAGTGDRKRSVPSRRPAFSTGDSASRRFGHCSPPGAGCERNLPSGGIASGDFAPASIDRWNHHWQKSSAGHRVFIADVGAVGRPGTVHASALHWRSSRGAGDSRHSRGRNQRSSLPATISVAGSALDAFGLVAPSPGWPGGERPKGASRLPWQPTSTVAAVTTSQIPGNSSPLTASNNRKKTAALLCSPP